jgi:hypothetical protein
MVSNSLVSSKPEEIITFSENGLASLAFLSLMRKDLRVTSDSSLLASYVQYFGLNFQDVPASAALAPDFLPFQNGRFHLII